MSSITFAIERVEPLATQKKAVKATRLTHRRPLPGKPLRIKTSQTTDIDTASVSTLARRFDTEPFMKALSATKEWLLLRRNRDEVLSRRLLLCNPSRGREDRSRFGGRQPGAIAIAVTAQTRGVVPRVLGGGKRICLGSTQQRVVTSISTVRAVRIVAPVYRGLHRRRFPLRQLGTLASIPTVAALRDVALVFFERHLTYLEWSQA
jgi:hypothetical protein